MHFQGEGGGGGGINFAGIFVNPFFSQVFMRKSGERAAVQLEETSSRLAMDEGSRKSRRPIQVTISMQTEVVSVGLTLEVFNLNRT